MTDPERTRHVVVSAGDPAGCAPELIEPLIDSAPDSVKLTVVGPPAVPKRINLNLMRFGESGHEWVNVGEFPADEVLSGTLGERSGKSAYRSLLRAVEIVENGENKGLLTLPLSKDAVHHAGHDGFRGHTAFFESHWDCRAVMAFFGESLNVALLTRHIPLRKIPEVLTIELVEQQIKTVSVFFERYVTDDPELALLGLNPHAGEKGLLGDEEQEILDPAIDRLKDQGIQVDGPFAPDSFFPIHAERYDGVLSCYHDQGLVPFKMNHFYTGVHTTMGLSVLRVSPDHGVAADLAGQGEVDPRSAVNSLNRLCEWMSMDEPGST